MFYSDNMFKVARAAVLLGISCVGTYELLSTSLFPQWGCRDLKEVTDQDKVSEVHKIMRRMNVKEDEIKKIKVFEGEDNTCLGSKYR